MFPHQNFDDQDRLIPFYGSNMPLPLAIIHILFYEILLESMMHYKNSFWDKEMVPS